MAKNLLHKKLCALAACFVMLAMLNTSCSDDEVYVVYDPLLVNDWVLAEVDGYPVSGFDNSVFSFMADGTGLYGQYDESGRWMDYPIEWGITPDDYLYVDAGGGEIWMYDYRVTYSTLSLIDIDTGQNLFYVSAN